MAYPGHAVQSRPRAQPETHAPDKPNPEAGTFSRKSAQSVQRGDRAAPPARSQAAREVLLAIRARLQGERTQMADSALNSHRTATSTLPNHLADLASDNFEQEVTLNLLGNANGALEQIEVALQRIEDGRYGMCDECGIAIPEARLEAIPYAVLCVRCASRQERQGHLPRRGPV